jgi:PIN domain nuclease of toxin-antitoxin system
MKALLDTSVFLWAIDECERLSERSRQAIEDPETDLFLSVASLWEITLKAAKGKLLTGMEPTAQARFLQTHIRQLGVSLLPVESSHVLALVDLPPIHKDPFDRLLVAQARIENLTLISGYAYILAYPGATLW